MSVFFPETRFKTSLIGLSLFQLELPRYRATDMYLMRRVKA